MRKKIDFYDLDYCGFNIQAGHFDRAPMFLSDDDLRYVVLKRARGSKIDPVYHSTDNWKTERQWVDLGFRVLPPWLWPVGSLLGYTSSSCRDLVIRIHRSCVRR